MTAIESAARRFEEERPRLHRIASRMLGSASDADDAVQETWLRLSRADIARIDDLTAWLTTVVSRACLDALRARASRREHPLELSLDLRPAEADPGADPERSAEIADSVALALFVVMDECSPAERVAFVLHDIFGIRFEVIGHVLERSPGAAKMLASRARRRVRVDHSLGEPAGSADREVVDAFFAAATGGDIAGLLRVLAPDVVMTARSGGTVDRIVGAAAIASRAAMFARPDAVILPAIVGGRVGVLVTAGGRPLTVMSFTIAAGAIEAIDGLTDPDGLAQIVPSWVR